METRVKKSMLESPLFMYKDLQRWISGVLVFPLQDVQRSSSWRTWISTLMLGFCWFLLHLVVNVVHIFLGVKRALESYLVSSGLFGNHANIPVHNLRYLAIVVDSEEALRTSRVIKLLQWLSDIGVKNICLYDMEGVLKKNKEILLKSISNAKPWEEADENASFQVGEAMTLEFLCVSDGKEGCAKAAGFLCSRYLKLKSSDREEPQPVFTEKDMHMALKAVGCGGPEPDLLLIYGPVRCHFGFPAWRMRYTELVHMGSLESMKFGSLIKAIQQFTRIKQNYGK